MKCVTPRCTAAHTGAHKIFYFMELVLFSAHAETINGLYKAELIHRRTWKTRESVERFGESDGCITLTHPTQFEQLRSFLHSQKTEKIPGTELFYYGKVVVQ